jgi:RES domain
LTPDEPPITRFRGRTHRLIASRWPTIGVFDNVALAEDLEAALLLETLTNDRVTATLVKLGRLDRSERITGQPGTTLIMAAFCHPAPGGGRFNNEALGAWYCAKEIETAISETVYHHTRRLAHSASGFRHVIPDARTHQQGRRQGLRHQVPTRESPRTL